MGTTEGSVVSAKGAGVASVGSGLGGRVDSGVGSAVGSDVGSGEGTPVGSCDD